MVTTQLQTLGTQVQRPINSPILSAAEDKGAARKLPFDYMRAAVSYYNALPDGEYKDAALGILKTLAKGEHDLEAVADNLVADLYSTDSGKSGIALSTLQHVLSLYDISMTPTDPDGPVIKKMREAVDIHQMINGD